MRRMTFGIAFGLYAMTLPLSVWAAREAPQAAQTPARPATPPPAAPQTPSVPAPQVPTPAPAKPPVPVPFPTDARIAYVDVQAILDRSSLGKAGQEKVRQLQEKKSAELGAKNTELQKKQQEIQTNQSVWTAGVLAQRTGEATKLQGELQFMQQQAQTDLESLQEQLLREFQDKVLPIIERVRTERKLWIVLAAGGGNNGIIAVDPGLDLSDEVVKRLDAEKQERPERPLGRAFDSGSRRDALFPPAAGVFFFAMTNIIPSVLEHLAFRYPAMLVDGVTRHEPGRRIVAVKNVTVSEEFFQGHFPGAPTFPAVLMIESLAQVATLLLAGCDKGEGRAWLRGVDNAKFRRQVVPGDRLEIEVTMGRTRGRIARAAAVASVDGRVVAEADLVIVRDRRAPDAVAAGVGMRTVGGAVVHETAIVQPGARIGDRSTIGPHAFIGAHVAIGQDCKVGASTVIDGHTEIGDGNEIYPFASVGLAPQDLKFRGEPTKLVIGRRNVFREFVTIHRGTAGGGGATIIGDRNLFMAYAHVAHDCRVGNSTIFGNGATLGGHVCVEDFATISAYSGVHQFCRVGQHAFIGGYTVVTRDALPFAKTVGNRARIYGVNTIGLARRGFSEELIGKLRRAYRHLVQHNTSRALELIERDPSLAAPEVSYLVNFILSAQRGVILRRPSKRLDDLLETE